VAADAAAVTEVIAAVESSLYGPSTFSQTDLVGEWAELDVGRDTHVVRDGDRIVAYAMLREWGGSWRAEGYVHPDAVGRGIGTMIVARLEADVARRGGGRLRHGVLEADQAGRQLFQSLGYRPARVFREMRIELEAPPPAAEWPPGLHVTPFDPARDAAAFHAAYEDAFADHWDHVARDLASWSRINLETGRFDAALCCVLRAGDEIAAGTICAGDTFGGGWVHILFTRRAWRRRGVGAGLLRDAFARLWARGERSVGLGVDTANATGAFALYERAGMEPAMGWVVYEKHLTGRA